MSSCLQLVLSNPNEGLEAEFNEWYAGDHLVHGIETPGVLSGQRFHRAAGPWPCGKHDYLMIWELDNPALTLAELAKVKGTAEMPISPAINMDTVQPPTMWRRAEVRSAARVVTDSLSKRTIVFGLFTAFPGEDHAFATSILGGGLRELADRPGIIAAEYLTLADEQIRGNCRKFPHGLLIELDDDRTALEALADPLARLPHADPDKWQATVFRPLGPKVTKQGAERIPVAR